MPYKNKEDKRKYQREWVARRRREWIETHGPCALCGSDERLEVDHIDPSTKITNSVWSWSSERRAAELAKCRVLYYECHKHKSATEMPKGEDCSFSKLTEQDVLAIRAEHQPRVHGKGYKRLAQKYGVDHKLIQFIVRRKIWTHI